MENPLSWGEPDEEGSPDNPADFLQGCPYLGLVDDLKTQALFVTSAHRCFAAGDVAVVSFEHQEQFCRSALFTTCSTYRDAKAGADDGSLTDVAEQTKPDQRAKAGVAVALAAAGAGLFLFVLPGGSQDDSLSQTPRPPSSLIQASASTKESKLAQLAVAPPAVATITSTSPTSLPSPSSVPVPTAVAELTPREHLIVSGETISSIAELYGVTVQELMQANDLDDTLIFAGRSLLVPGP